MLAEPFPDAVIDGFGAWPDLEFSLPGVHLSGRIHEGAREWAVMAIGRARGGG